MWAPGSAFWADPETRATIEVTANGYRVERVTELPAGKYVEVHFTLPRDTVAWPVPRSPVQIAQDLHLFDHFTPTTPKPVAPVAPHYLNAGAIGLLWGV